MDALKKLVKEFNFTSSDLRKFMSDSVAKRITDADFMEWLYKINKDHGLLNVKKLTKGHFSLLTSLFSRWTIIDNFLNFSARTKSWTQCMSNELCQRVPSNQTTQRHRPQRRSWLMCTKTKVLTVKNNVFVDMLI
jgi:hypothetical protein